MKGSTAPLRTLAASLTIAALVAAPAFTRAGAQQGRGGSEQAAPDRAGCVFCAAYAQYSAALHRATREVGALPNGVVIHLRCEHPETVVEIQKYTFEKQRLREQYWKNSEQVRTCATCQDLLLQIKGARFEVSNSVHGVFTIITSDDPGLVRALHELASKETKDKDVRGS